MPNIADIVEMAELLGDRPVLAVAERCVVVRNRNATCRKCQDACLADAIAIHNNELSIDAASCVGCGACTVVCPTEAIVALDPSDEELSLSAASAFAEAGEGAAAIACARIASKGIGDPHKFAEVSCLARVDESVLLGLAALGAKDILLVDGCCSSCKYRSTSPGVDATVDSANALLACCEGEAQIRRVSEFPQEMLLADASSLLGEARRGFFTSATSWTADAAGKTAKMVIRKNLGMAEKSKTLREKLGARGGGLPKLEEHRRPQILDAMDRIGVSGAQVVTTRLFGTVRIDIGKCNACGMCAVFCPTGALSKSAIKVQPNEDGTNDGGSFLEFSCADCSQCGLCVDACMKKCLTIEDQLSTDELFDFEPRFIYLPKPGKRAGLL